MDFNYEEFCDMVDVDLNLKYDDLQNKLFEIPKLYSKYMRIYFEQKQLLDRMETKAEKLYRKKYYYYSFDHDVKLDSAKEIQFHVMSDEEYSKVNSLVKKQKAIVELTEKTAKKMENLSFDVKNCIEYLKYINGV